MVASWITGESARAVGVKPKVSLFGVPKVHNGSSSVTEGHGADHDLHASDNKSGCITQLIAQFPSF
jgi:hypothetical protein